MTDIVERLRKEAHILMGYSVKYHDFGIELIGVAYEAAGEIERLRARLNYWQDESRTFTTIERVRSVRIDCSTGRLATA